MSTTANIGLNQPDYIMINMTESSTSSISSETSITTRTLPMNGDVKSDWITIATPPSQEEVKSAGKAEDGRQLVTETSESNDHKAGSGENSETADAAPPRNVMVTSESSASEKVGEGKVSLPPSSSRETGATSAAPGGGGSSELQLPAKQALAVLSSVSNNIIMI